MLQYRVAPEGQVRDVDENKRQVLVEIPWEVIDTYNTDFARDAFDEFFAQRMPVMCWQHKRDEPIGRALSAQKGQRANLFVSQFSDFDAVPRARQAFAQIRDKEITDFSFGFDQAKSEPHPSVRGAIRFVRARMPEISPVTIGAIPGAVAVGIRAEAEVANVRALLEAGAIDEDGANAMLRAAGLDPLPRQHVEVSDPKSLLEAAVRDALAGTGQRSLTITIGDDGAVSTSGDGGADDGDVEPSVSELAAAIDGAVDAALTIAAALDLSALPAGVGQMVQLLHAADVAADELLEVLGLPDPDAGDEPDDDTIEAARAAAAEIGDGERAHIGFHNLEKVLAAKGAADPAALAAYIGRKKYGRAGMAALAAKGRLAHKRAAADGDDAAMEKMLADCGLRLDHPDVNAALHADLVAMGVDPAEAAAKLAYAPRSTEDLDAQARAAFDRLNARVSA